MKSARFLLASSLWVAAVGCASIYTVSDPSAAGHGGDGIAYYLPNQTIKIEVAIDDKGAMTPKVSSGESYADTRQSYLIRAQQNWVGASKAKVGVNRFGLLTTTTAETTSQVGEVLKNAAASAGGLESLWSASANAAACAKGMTHSLQLRIEDLSFTKSASTWTATAPSLCGYAIIVTRTFDAEIAPPAAPRASDQRAGLYYRQALPYSVTMTRLVPPPEPPAAPKAKAKQKARKTAPPPPAPPARSPEPTYQVVQFLVFSTTGAPTHFAPLPRSLFASSNKTTVTFDNGVLTDVDRSVDSELVSIAKLPADVLTSYTTALGAAFTARNTQETNELKARLWENQRTLTDLQIRLCREAATSGDAAKIAAACATAK